MVNLVMKGIKPCFISEKPFKWVKSKHTGHLTDKKHDTLSRLFSWDQMQEILIMMEMLM